MMALPDGTFKGLARVLAPLWLWMAAGWAAYPRMMGFISGRMGEALDFAEVETFSLAMVGVCIALCVALVAYGFSGREADEAELRALGRRPELCPFCRSELPPDAGQCLTCGRRTLK